MSLLAHFEADHVYGEASALVQLWVVVPFWYGAYLPVLFQNFVKKCCREEVFLGSYQEPLLCQHAILEHGVLLCRHYTFGKQQELSLVAQEVHQLALFELFSFG